MYELEGSTGLEVNVAAAWDAWIGVNRATDDVDVTAEFNKAMEQR